MIFRDFGDKSQPTIILLHGGGLSWWSLQDVIRNLATDYHIVTPIIDGHGEDGNETFISIEYSANKLIEYIDTYCNGKVYAIGGLSLGAQIVTEILTQRNDIASYAMIESALVYPIKGITSLTVPMYKICYGLIRKKWFSKIQSKTLCVPDYLFTKYYEDSLKISKQSLINITLSNGNYRLKEEIRNTKSKVMVIVGEKELGIMKMSAEKISNTIPDCSLHIAKKLGHGALSILHTSQYCELLRAMFSVNEVSV